MRFILYLLYQISNTRSIVAYDSKFALTYLPEKVQLLHYMRKGDINLYIQACAEVYNGLRSVGLLENLNLVYED